jgi:uncharacterized protein (DUF1501 family)
MSIRRRDIPGLFFGAALGGLGLASGLGRRARAEVPADSRRFLFVFADGGWDPTWVFAPAFDNPNVDMPTDGSFLAEEGGLQWVSHNSRPSVDRFFRSWGPQTCILNGMEVRSIAHERCKRLLLTGSATPGVADFPTRIASGGGEHLALGHLVFSGPAYQAADSEGTVRVGTRGQLAALLDGGCATGSDPALSLPPAAVQSLEDAYVQARVATVAGKAGRGAEQRVSDAYLRALQDIPEAERQLSRLSSGSSDSLSQLLTAVDLLGSGASRCAMVEDLGYYGARWDHHSELNRQSPSYEALFSNLQQVMELMSRSPGLHSASLLEEITVVVFSEMGRFPALNNSMGKDHWMTTSLMLLGGGIRGGQVVGAYGDNFTGVPIVPETGELDPSGKKGVLLSPAHVGATLLQLAGMDPAEAFGKEIEPISAVLSA